MWEGIPRNWEYSNEKKIVLISGVIELTFWGSEVTQLGE